MIMPVTHNLRNYPEIESEGNDNESHDYRFSNSD